MTFFYSSHIPFLTAFVLYPGFTNIPYHTGSPLHLLDLHSYRRKQSRRSRADPATPNNLKLPHDFNISFSSDYPERIRSLCEWIFCTDDIIPGHSLFYGGFRVSHPESWHCFRIRHYAWLHYFTVLSFCKLDYSTGTLAALLFVALHRKEKLIYFQER